MTDAQRCSECGETLPDNSLEGICPRCAFALAMSDTEFSLADDAESANAEPESQSPVGDSRNSTTRQLVMSDSSGSSGGAAGRRRRGGSSRWWVIAFVVLLAAYGLARQVRAPEQGRRVFDREGDNAARWYYDQYREPDLAADEAIVAIRGRRLAGGNVPEQLTDALEESRIVFWIASGEGEREEVVPSIDWSVQWARLLVGIVIATLGAAVYWMKPHGKAAYGFLAFCLVVGVLWILRSIPFYLRFTAEDVLYLVFQTFLPGAGFVFALTFTPLGRLVRSPRVAVGVTFAVCLGVLALSAVLRPGSILEGVYHPFVFRVWSWALLGVLLCTLPFGLWARVSGLDLTPTDRQRSRILRAAILLSFLPPILFILIGRSIDLPMNQSLMTELVVLFFPAMVGYAVLRHNLLALSDLAIEGALYGLFLAFLAGAYGGAVSLASGFLPEQEGMVHAAFVGVAVVASIPVHTRVRTTMQRRFDRVAFDYEALVDTVDDLATSDTSLDDYCHAVARRMSRAALTEDVHLILRRPGARGLTLTGTTQHGHSDDLLFDCQMLIEDLQEGASEISLDELLDDWPDASCSSTLRAMRELRANLVFPLRARGQLVGALALGRRVDYRNYTRGEIKTFRRVARHLGATLMQMISRMATVYGERIADLYPACPERIGRYAIDRVLGEGATAYVYRGRSSDGWAALKVCNRRVQSSRTLMERFHREAKAMQRIDHPNVMRVLDVGWEGPEAYIAVDYFPAGSLEDLLARTGPLDEPQALRYLGHIVDGLEAAQKQGVIHRDIKPRNLFMGNEDRIVIGDFGFARLEDESTLTRRGEMFGTPHYISPEVLEGDDADWRADQYAAGVTLFYMLTGRRPFEAEKLEVLYHKYMTEPVPDVREFRPEVSEGTAALIARMTQAARKRRFDSYGKVRAATRQVGAIGRVEPERSPVRSGARTK